MKLNCEIIVTRAGDEDSETDFELHWTPPTVKDPAVHRFRESFERWLLDEAESGYLDDLIDAPDPVGDKDDVDYHRNVDERRRKGGQ